jgi:hypothetical protein
MASDPAITALRAVVKGLTYPSESDEPFEVFRWTSGEVGGDLTRKGVLALGGHGAKDRIREQTPDEFFAPLTAHEKWHGAEETATVDRYHRLAGTVGTVMETPRVYTVGGGPEKTIYVVGKTKSGDWVGVKTTAIET